MLLAAGGTLLDQPRMVAVGARVAAAGAAEALRPAAQRQMGPALRVGAEARQERRQIPRQVPHQPVRHRALLSMFLLRSLYADRRSRQPA